MRVTVILNLKRKDVEERSEIQLIFSFSHSPLCSHCYIYHILIDGKDNLYEQADTPEAEHRKIYSMACLHLRELINPFSFENNLLKICMPWVFFG